MLSCAADALWKSRGVSMRSARDHLSVLCIITSVSDLILEELACHRLSWNLRCSQLGKALFKTAP